MTDEWAVWVCSSCGRTLSHKMAPYVTWMPNTICQCLYPHHVTVMTQVSGPKLPDVAKAFEVRTYGPYDPDTQKRDDFDRARAEGKNDRGFYIMFPLGLLWKWIKRLVKK